MAGSATVYGTLEHVGVVRVDAVMLTFLPLKKLTFPLTPVPRVSTIQRFHVLYSLNTSIMIFVVL